ncbi:MAG: hypothetical protein AAF170_04350 [Bacteroidota bacterium]
MPRYSTITEAEAAPHGDGLSLDYALPGTVPTSARLVVCLTSVDGMVVLDRSTSDDTPLPVADATADPELVGTELEGETAYRVGPVAFGDDEWRRVPRSTHQLVAEVEVVAGGVRRTVLRHIIPVERDVAR